MQQGLVSIAGDGIGPNVSALAGEKRRRDQQDAAAAAAAVGAG